MADTVVWADIVGCEDDVEILTDVQADPPRELTAPEKSSACRKPHGDTLDEEILSALQLLTETNDNAEMDCRYSEISTSCETIMKYMLNGADENIKFNCADVFFRSRHESLFDIVSKFLKLEAGKSDVPFCSLFGINSSRTPDHIYVDGKSVLVLEITATTGVDKAYASKGDVNMGYQSKYSPEISELTDMGYAVQYEVFVFDMHDEKNTEYRQSLRRCVEFMQTTPNTVYRRVLETTRMVWLEVTRLLRSSLNIYASGLYAGSFLPTKAGTVSQLLLLETEVQHTRFIKASVSSSTYNKILNSWPRFGGILDQFTVGGDEGLYKLDLDLSRNKFEFNKAQEGLDYGSWSVVINNRDRSALLKNFRLFYSGTRYMEDRSDIEYYVESKELVVDTPKWFMEVHEHSNPCNKAYQLKDFGHLIAPIGMYKGEHLFYDVDYSEKLTRMLSEYYRGIGSSTEFELYCSGLKNKKPFSLNVVNQEQIQKAVTDYDNRYTELNNFSDISSSRVRYQKPSFIYPLISPSDLRYTSYNEKNTDILSWVCKVLRGTFTGCLSERALSSDYVYGTTMSNITTQSQDLIEDRRRLQSLLNKHIRTQKKDCSETGIKYNRSADTVATAMKAQINSITKRLPEGKKDIHVISLGMKGKDNRWKSMFKEEMSHYRAKTDSHSYKGVGRFDLPTLQQEFQQLLSELRQPSEIECPDMLMDDKIGDDVEFLKMLKQVVVNKANACISELRNTNIYHSCAMVSRLCYTLAYFSQSNFKGSDFLFDNLGTNNVLLICKGGKKVFSTKKSKFFRLIFPSYDAGVSHYSRPGYNGSYQLHYRDGTPYIITPWAQMDETVMNDGLTFLHRTMGFLLLQGSFDIKLELNRTIFNIILAYNNRRKVEALMHNMRYITVNCLSDVACISKMLPEMAGFNYDFLECLIRESICANFTSLATGLKSYHDNTANGLSVEHLVNREFIMTSDDDLTLAIYSTFLMSKAPVTQSLEQASNLHGMLETHSVHEEVRSAEFIGQYEHTTTINNCNGVENYWGGLFSSDFNYDPAYVCTLGRFAADYILSKTTVGDLSVKWENMLKQPWDEFANTKGLRGDMDNDFFNRKGYYIVYNEVLKSMDSKNRLTAILESGLTDQKKKIELQKLNQPYSEKINSIEVDSLIFHVVDKRQRGGSREIFVMDYKTKICQQPIEKFAKHLCKLFPSEVISVPSNRRLFQIHSAVFERRNAEEGKTYNAVLDCRRWAPHSVINKFIDFILCMRHVLPPSFVQHSIWFFEKLIEKRVYTKNYVRDILQKNEASRQLVEKYLIKDKEVDGYYFTMPYSWVMGIFNYFSSLMHVVNQMHASHIINRVSQSVLSDGVTYTMYAHSDDSAGKIISPTLLDLRKTFFIYELLLKASNHMLSDKKCNLGGMYFEFVSVLYLDNTLMNLLTKFVGSFAFHPSDKGYAIDVSDSYSKAIELVSNGATFEIAYIAFRLSVKMIHRFYFGNNMSQHHYRLPPHLLGIPDAHPLMVLIAGADADVVRLHLTEKPSHVDKIYHVCSVLLKDDPDTSNFLKSCIAKPRILKNSKISELAEALGSIECDDGLEWILKNVPLSNTAINSMKLSEMLKNVSFQAALQDESVTRRLSRAFYYRNSRCLDLYHGSLSYAELHEVLMITFFSDVLDVPHITDLSRQLAEEVELKNHSTVLQYKQAFEFLHSEIITFCERLNHITFNPSNVERKEKKCKPVHIKIMKHQSALVSDYQPEGLAAWIAFPNHRWLLDSKGYANKMGVFEEFLQTNLPCVRTYDTDITVRLLRKMKDKSLKEMHIYSNMPAHARDISTYKDLLMFLSENSFHGTVINKIVTPYDRKFSEGLPGSVQNLVNDISPDILPHIFFYNCLRSDGKSKILVDKLLLNEYLGKQHANFRSIVKADLELVKDDPMVGALMSPYISLLLGCDQTSGRVHVRDNDELYYHCFVKRQHFIQNMWLGVGELYLSLGRLKLSLHLSSGRVVSVTSNLNRYDLNNLDTVYLDTVLRMAQLGPLRTHMQTTPMLGDWSDTYLGIDESGIYSVNQKRTLDAYIPMFNLSALPNKPYANLAESWVTMGSGLDLVAKSSEFETVQYLIKTINVPATECIPSLTKLLVNETNMRVVESSANDVTDLIELILSQGVDAELHCSAMQIFENYNSSFLYKIFKRLRDNDVVDVHRVKPRKNLHPGQHGGLLSALIDYKNLDDGFRFNYKNVLTPEMMIIKGSQPEAFISELKTGLLDKYNSLYSPRDKQTILKELRFISGMDDPEKNVAKLVQLMATWGYTGVMGALEGFDENIDMTAESFYRYNLDSTYYSEVCTSCAKLIISAYVDAAETLMQIPFLKTDVYQSPKNIFELKCCIISFVHVYVLSSYNSAFGSQLPQLLRADVNMVVLTELLLGNSDFKHTFHNKISEMPILSKLYFEQKDAKVLVRLLKTCLMNGIHNERYAHKLTLKKMVNRMPDGVPEPYVRTKAYLEGILTFSVKSLKSYGIIPPKLHSWLRSAKRIDYKNTTYLLDFEICEPHGVRVDFNPTFLLNRPLEEDYLCEDWLDLSPELIEIPVDPSVFEMPLVYDPKEDRRVFIGARGNTNRAIRLKPKVVSIVGFANNTKPWNKLRQLGETLVIITDRVEKTHVLDLGNTIKCFQFSEKTWAGDSLTMPQDLLVYVWDSQPINVGFWCHALGLEPFKMETFLITANKAEATTMREKWGDVVEEFFTDPDTEDLMNAYNKAYQLYLESKTLKVEASDVVEEEEPMVPEVNPFKEKMMKIAELAPTSEKLAKYQDLVKPLSEQGGVIQTEEISNIIETLLKSEEGKKMLVKSVEGTLDSIGDKDTIMRIWQTPGIFCMNNPTNSEVKNKSLKEGQLRAEIECFCVGLCNKILSGTLFVNKELKSSLLASLKVAKGYIRGCGFDKQNKQFIADFCTLVMNDSIPIDGKGDDAMLRNLIDFLNRLIIINEEQEGDYDDPYSLDAGGARIRYHMF